MEGTFVPPAGHPSLERATEAGAILDDGALLVVRTVASQGRSRAHLGGRSVPRGLLAEGADLITVHGQSDQLRLRSPAQQRRALDSFAGGDHRAALHRYTEAHAARQAAENELAGWDADSRAREDELERLTRALEAIDALDPQDGEDADLRAEAERLGNVEDLRLAAGTAREAVGGAEDPAAPEGALAVIDHARRTLAPAAEHDPTLAEWTERLDTVSYQLSDLLTEIGSYLTGLEADPDRLEQVHERRAALTELIRAHSDGGTLADLLAFGTAARSRVGELTAPGAGRDALIARLTELQEAERTLAEQITAGRVRAAAAMAEATDAELRGLAMPGASSTVQTTPLAELGPWGAEDVQLLLSEHPGAPALPLGARGPLAGKLSRVMLALEVALARQQAETDEVPVPLPTFVFDEVDAGVGGRAAVEVGARLAELAERTQVIVVTHLPQVAAFADRHLVVTKSIRERGEAVTASDIRAVTGTDRETELARMLSGDPDSATARQHAARAPRAPRRGSIGGMISLLRGRSRDEDASAEALSVVRVDRRTKSLTKRLRAGEIAVIDHLDIDRVSAEALVACRPAAVLNAAASISGRYPNMGPDILLAADIPLIDELGSDVMTLTEGSRVRIDGDSVYDADGTVIAEGTRQTQESVSTAMEEARAGLSVQLEAFAANTMDYMRRERELLLDGVGVPEVSTEFDGRHVLIVVRGYPTKRTWPCSAPTCASTGRCWSVWTAARTRSWTRACVRT